MKSLIAAFVFGSFAAIAADLNDAAPPRSLTGQVETRGDINSHAAETQRLVAGQAQTWTANINDGSAQTER